MGCLMPLRAQSEWGRGYGTVLDSGTTFTYFIQPAFLELSEYIKAHVAASGLKIIGGPDPHVRARFESLVATTVCHNGFAPTRWLHRTGLIPSGFCFPCSTRISAGVARHSTLTSFGAISPP